MRTVGLFAVLFSLVAALVPRANAHPKGGSPLGLPVFPVSLENLPLPTALGKLGSRVRNGYVLFGVELRLKNGREPSVNVDIPAGGTLGEALALIFHGLPDYRYEVLSEHLINVYPSDAKQDPNDALNLRVPRLDIVSEQAGNVLSRPRDYISQLEAHVSPLMPKSGPPTGIPSSVLSDVGPPEVSLHVKNVTVRQILNMVSQATENRPAKYLPLGWVYSFGPDPKLPGGGKHIWAVLWSVPHDWKQQAEITASEAPN